MSQSNLTAIRPVVDESVIELFEEMVERARRGELLGALVIYRTRGKTGTTKAGEFDRTQFVFAMEMAKLGVIQDAFQQAIDDAEEEDDSS